ncbi:MAG: glycosyltransferase family 39 protein [Candidatus Eremiobacteraeota bacterium]|nr:glycosyltransferase family 39 protein [Candidatus Eremiobacteraeota bacterium]
MLALATAVIHLALCHRFGYYRDEFYFIDCAKHLAWGYVDQPPLAPFVTWLSSPLGYPVWAVRALPAILAGVTTLLACAIAAELGGAAFAQALTGLTVVFAPGLIGIHYGLSTEFLSPASWTALIYLTIRLVKTRDERLYLPIALVVTLGLYAKYSIAACAVALALGMALTGHARLLRSRLLLVAIATVLLLTLPNALWQITHGLPMLETLHNDQLNRHALANGMADESPNRWINALYMFGLQFAYNNPAYAAVWIWGLAWLWRSDRSDRDDIGRYRYLAVAYLLLFVVLIATIGRGYYIQGFYPALFAAGAVAIERALDARRARSRGWNGAQPAILAGTFVLGLPMFPLSIPVLSLPSYMAYERAIGLSRPAPPDNAYHLINPMFADQLGWPAMTQTVAGAYWALPARQRNITAIFADRYAYAGALDFYGPRYGLPTVISPNNNYYLWGTRGYTGQSVLAVGATDYRLLLRWFGSVRQVAVYRNDLRWMLEGPLPIYWCTRPRAPLPAMWPHFKYYGL